jgi:hypothetical protein
VFNWSSTKNSLQALVKESLCVMNHLVRSSYTIKSLAILNGLSCPKICLHLDNLTFNTAHIETSQIKIFLRELKCIVKVGTFHGFSRLIIVLITCLKLKLKLNTEIECMTLTLIIFTKLLMNLKWKNKNKLMARQSLHIGHSRHGLFFTRLDCQSNAKPSKHAKC